MQTEVASARGLFFEYLFTDQSGYICIATANKDLSGFKEHYFEWPKARKEVLSFIEQQTNKKHVWYCTSLLDVSKRNKDNCMAGSFLWSEFDIEIDQIEFDVEPSMVISSSPGKYHCYWRLEHVINPEVQEDLNKRITYKYGADKGGWHLNKLLRVPLTYNHKYDDTPLVELLYSRNARLPLASFESLESTNTNGDVPDGLPDMPDVLTLPDHGLVIHKYAYHLDGTGFKSLYADEPHDSEDWSARMWRLINICIEAGMDNDEIFSVAIQARCNKYERDNRPISYLWREILKAAALQSHSFSPQGELKPLVVPDIVPMDYEPTANFVYEYKAWASRATDAVPEYHELAAFMALSSICAAGVKLKVDWGTLYPNLWGLILGDSTLTRKTTAMRMAMDMVNEVDDSALLATDGSAEGLLTGLSSRPKRVSIFFKDEVSGFFDSINRKDYLAGMPELLTQLYDVPTVLSRMLRKETITISQPYFIFFGGGIRDKVFELITEDYVLSGFLPRFLIVSGDADIGKLRRTGPPTESATQGREALVSKLKKMHQTYNHEVEVSIGGQLTTMQAEYQAYLTDEAWETFGDIEHTLVHAAQESYLKAVALPTFTRLAFSILKMAMLLAAARNEPDSSNRLRIDVDDILDASYYGRKFGNHAIGLITSAGLSTSERQLHRILKGIEKKPGITRSELAQRYRLRAKETKEVIDTLVMRGHITVKQEGRGMRFYPVEV